jgi:hypothetical protein
MAGEIPQVRILLNEDRPEPPLEEPALPPVPPVEQLRIASDERAHSVGEAAGRSLDQQLVAVAVHAVAVESSSAPPADGAKERKEPLPVPAIAETRPRGRACAR